MLYIIDSYAWVEYFIGSKKGKVLKKLFLNERNQFITVECCLAEIKWWALRNSEDFDNLFRIIRSNSLISNLTEHDWIHAGEERFEQRKTQKDFGLIDAVILVKSRERNSMIVTGDKHFKKIKDVVFLE